MLTGVVVAGVVGDAVSAVGAGVPGAIVVTTEVSGTAEVGGDVTDATDVAVAVANADDEDTAGITLSLPPAPPLPPLPPAPPLPPTPPAVPADRLLPVARAVPPAVVPPMSGVPDAVCSKARLAPFESKTALCTSLAAVLTLLSDCL